MVSAAFGPQAEGEEHAVVDELVEGDGDVLEDTYLFFETRHAAALFCVPPSFGRRMQDGMGATFSQLKKGFSAMCKRLIVYA